MSRTVINVTAVVGAASQINSAKGSISSAKSSFTQTKNGIDSKVKGRNNINGRLNTVQNQLSSIYNRVNKIGSTVQTGADSYRAADDKVNKERKKISTLNSKSAIFTTSKYEQFFDKTFKKKIEEIKAFIDSLPNKINADKDKLTLKIMDYSEDEESLTAALIVLMLGDTAFSLFGVESEDPGDIFDTEAFKSYLLKIKNGESVQSFFNTEKSNTISLKTDLDLDKLDKHIDKFKKKAEDYLKDKKLYDKNEKTKYYKDDEEIGKEDAPDFYERKSTVAELKKEAQAKVSAYEAEGNFLGGTGSVTVGEAECHAGVAAGLYIIGDDNKQIFSPGVSAEVGASVTVFNAEYENQLLGNEMIGANIEGEVTALSAEAGASAEANFLGVNDKGKVVFDPQLNVGAKAEAVLVEAEGSVGVNVLGGEASLNGSVKVGVGAHADIGIKDGVVKCEIGASLGIGFDVGFEVDVGGMANTVVDGAKSAWNTVKGWFD